MDLKQTLCFFFSIFVLVINCQKDVLEIETDMRGRLNVPTFENEHHIDPFQNESEKKQQKNLFEYGSFERGIMPSAGSESGYGHPADRYKKKNNDDESEPLPVAETESESASEVNENGQQKPIPLVVNGVQNVPIAIADTDSDPDPDPFTFKRRIMANSGSFLVPDAYGAAPIIQPELESAFTPKLSNIDATTVDENKKALSEKSILEQLSFEDENSSEFPLTDFKNDRIVRRQNAAPIFRDETIEPAFPLPSCYRTTAGFLCCNRILEELIYRSNTIIKEKHLSKCNIHAFAQDLEAKAENQFQTTFEIVIGTGDFASKIRFKDNLVCKTIADNKVVLIYGTPEPYPLTKSKNPIVFV